MTDWINALDRLPELHEMECEMDGEIYKYKISDKVLIISDDETSIRFIEENDGKIEWFDMITEINTDVSYWLPMPELPKGVKKDA